MHAYLNGAITFIQKGKVKISPENFKISPYSSQREGLNFKDSDSDSNLESESESESYSSPNAKKTRTRTPSLYFFRDSDSKTSPNPSLCINKTKN